MNCVDRCVCKHTYIQCDSRQLGCVQQIGQGMCGVHSGSTGECPERVCTGDCCVDTNVSTVHIDVSTQCAV